MKHQRITWIAVLLIAALLAGCGPAAPTTPQTEAPATTAAPTEAPTEAATVPVTEDTEPTVPAETGENIDSGEDTVSAYVDAAYAEQIGRYYAALSRQWDENQYLDSELSTLASYYNEAGSLEQAGFGYQDLDNDGSQELIIGAILNAEQDPVVFEIWTLVEGKPVMLAQSGSKNRYFLQFSEEDQAWYVAYEAVSSAATHGTYYLMLMDGRFEVMQGIVFDAAADEQNPWFMAYDLDWDVSNDEPIDEEMADAILENNRNHYTSVEYYPYSLYK